VRLGRFILQHMQAILTNWELFASTRLPAAASMEPLELRDHAQQILEAVAADLNTPQTREAQAAKSEGIAPVLFDAPETAAQTHATLRANSGFNIQQLVSEYRALRASVLRLWIDGCPPEDLQLDDMVRFNEAIDQALAESVEFFSVRVDQSRNLLLGVLGHDLRSPLQTIQMTAAYLEKLQAGEPVSTAARRLINSGARMRALLDDLLDYNRTNLGLGIRVAPESADLATLCADEVERIRAANPDRRIELVTSGDCRGIWDGTRVQQMLCNIIANALAYGAENSPVCVTVTGNESGVSIAVGNAGPAIERQKLNEIFAPLKRGADHENNKSGLGLGLYIAQEICKAHGGVIHAKSDDKLTEFAIRLPRLEAAKLISQVT
jgi:signal transduction histidine kinase